MSSSCFLVLPAGRKSSAYANAWTLADIRLLRELAQQGLTLGSIARRLRRSESAVRNKATMHGVSVQARHREVTAGSAGRPGAPGVAGKGVDIDIRATDQYTDALPSQSIP